MQKHCSKKFNLKENMHFKCLKMDLIFKSSYHIHFLMDFNFFLFNMHVKELCSWAVTKKVKVQTKQHTDRLCDPKRPCICWSTSLGQNLWSSPLYFPFDSSYVHPLIRNIHFFYSHKSVEYNSQQPSLASHIHKNANDYTCPYCKLLVQV
jgi:hypothetical protein